MRAAAAAFAVLSLSVVGQLSFSFSFSFVFAFALVFEPVSGFFMFASFAFKLFSNSFTEFCGCG